MIYLETSRLQLRDWEESDLEPFSPLNEDEEVNDSYKSKIKVFRLQSRTMIGRNNDYNWVVRRK